MWGWHVKMWPLYFIEWLVGSLPSPLLKWLKQRFPWKDNEPFFDPEEEGMFGEGYTD